MQKKMKTAIMAGMAFMVGMPTTIVQAAGSRDYLTDGGNTLQRVNADSDAEAYFTNGDVDRRSWYTDRGKNRVYKTYKNGMYYYSPVRPRDVKEGLSNHEFIYENYKTKTLLSESSWNTRYLLVTRDRGSSLYNQNFKTKAKSVGTVEGVKGGGFVPSKNMDNTGTFAGRYGEWRYLGYSDDGATTGNAFFPEDYTENFRPYSYPYIKTPWKVGGWAEYFVPGSKYDTARKGSQNYDKKYAAVKLLLEQTPSMKSAKGKLANGKSGTVTLDTASKWMDYISVTSPIMNKTGTFRAAWDVRKGAGEKVNYIEYSLLNLVEQRNLMISRMEITDKETGDVVAVYTNNTPGKAKGTVSYRGEKVLYTQNKYDVKITVKNLNNSATRLSKSEVDAGFKKNYSPGVQYPSNFKGTNGNEYNRKIYGEKIPAKGQQNFYLKDVVIPDDQADKMVMMNSIIGAKHRVDSQDNLDTADDVGIIPIAVKAKPGDMDLDKIELIDENGNVAPQPIPGEKYKVRYTYEYTGGDIRNAVYVTRKDSKGNTYSEFSHYNYPNVNLAVRSQIERKLPLGSNGKYSSDLSQETIKLRSTVRNGQKFKFETKYRVYEFPYVKATGNFDITDDGYSRYNSGDDKGSKTWERPYDYEIEDLQVVPRTERSANSNKLKVAVSFTAVQDSPREASRVGFQQDLDMDITVNGTKKRITEHVVEGKNKNITVEMDVDAKPGDILKATVNVNPNLTAWEYNSTTDVFANNTKTTLGNLNAISSTGSNYGNSNTFGYFTNFMLKPSDDDWVQNTSNEWEQDYDVTNFSGNRVSYTSETGGTYQFTKYRGKPSRDSVEVDQNESYEIEKILFRSKFTKDNQLGDNKDGWVDMIAEDNPPRIKAGYGYELKVLVRYKTNALSTQPKKVDIPNFNARDSRKGNGTSVRAYHTDPNIPTDIFVKAPGIKETLSVSGANGSKPAFVLNTKESKLTREDQLFVYNLKPTMDMGIAVPGKLYVGEDVKDDDYDLSVWTPQINGIGTKNLDDTDGKTVYDPSLLGDKQEVLFQVNGSASDDLVDSIIQ